MFYGLEIDISLYLYIVDVFLFFQLMDMVGEDDIKDTSTQDGEVSWVNSEIQLEKSKHKKVSQLIEILKADESTQIKKLQELAKWAATKEEKIAVASIISQILALQTIHIYTWDEDKIKEIVFLKLLEIDSSKFENANFVLAELAENRSDNMWDFKWIGRAFDIHTKNPDQKIILMSSMPYEEFKKKNKDNTKWEFLSHQKNFRFLCLFDQDALKDFQDQTWFDFDKDIPVWLKPRPIKTFDAKTLETLFEPDHLSTIETNESLLNTIKFYESKNWHPYLKELFATLDLKKLNLGNSIVVDMRPEEWWDNMTGINVAYETLQQHPDAKIILCSLIPIDVFQKVIEWEKSAKYLKTLLQGKNVRIIQSSWWNSMTQEEVVKQFDGMYTDIQVPETDTGGKTFQQLAEIESEVSFQKLMESEISHFLHDATYRIDREQQKEMNYERKLEYFFFEYKWQKTDKRIEFENRLITLLQIQHPSFKLLPRENNLQWIIDMYKYSRAHVLPEWTRFEGVFVDRDWCLYDNKKFTFNQKVIDMIKEYEQQWKEIIVRTWGNLEMKQRLLDKEPQLKHIIIKSKTDYKWWTVEISIDNDTPEFLLSNAKIKAETYIKI